MAGLYIHIPFCKSRCSYCDFYSTTELTLIDSLVDCLCIELENEKDYINTNLIDTIYFGGGTPSLLSEKHFTAIFSKINILFETSNCKEISIEVNPDDIDTDFLAMLNKFPFNRISMGIQSLKKEELSLISRRHSADQSIQAIELCQQFGYENISVDIIYGYPSQTLKNTEETIDKLLIFNIKHISAYHLSYEKNTVLHQKLENKEITAIDEETSLEMFKLIVAKFKEKGFIQYEISNFSLIGFESKHNSAYWNNTPYLGIGPSAHSFNLVSRKWNIASLQKYIDGIKNNTSISEIENLSSVDRYNDYILTSVRTIKGASLHYIQNEFGEIRLEYCLKNASKHIKNNNLEISDEFLRLTKEGIFISDGIISDLLFVE